MVASAQTSGYRQNWAGSHSYVATGVHAPATVAEAQEIVARSERVRAFGARHSFNAITDSPGALISVTRLDRVVGLDRERGTVTVEGGITYGQLGAWLHRAGFALRNTASLPQITVAGACGTATHGSGDTIGSLATAVAALDLIAPDGTVVTLARDRDGERFRGAVVGLGATGIVARLTLDVVPTFQLRQDIYEDLPLEALDDSFEALMASGYSVSLFTNWREARIDRVWVKRRVEDGVETEVPAALYGAALQSPDSPPISSIGAGRYTTLGVAGPWHERLPHFHTSALSDAGAELQTEYFVPRADAVAALRVVAGLRERIAPLLMASEVRTIAADDLWLSPYYERDSVAIHFTWHPDWAGVGALLPDIEAGLAPFGPRPHWGKLFTLPPDRLAARYPRLPDFRALLGELDPAGKFRNAFVERTVFGAAGPAFGAG